MIQSEINSASLSFQEKSQGNTVIHNLIKYSEQFEDVSDFLSTLDLSLFLIKNYQNDTPLHLMKEELMLSECISLFGEKEWKEWNPQGFKNKTRNFSSS
jgi:hypothetical protein